MSPSWPLVFEPTSKYLLWMSAGSEAIGNFSIWGISSWSHLFIILSYHSRHPHLVNSCVLLIFNHTDFWSWRNYFSRAWCFDWNWLWRNDRWLGLHFKLGFILLLLSSSNFIIQKLLLLLCNLLLHFIKLLLSILYNIVNFTIFHFCLKLLVLFFGLFVDSADFL